MKTLKISSKVQVVIPKMIRSRLGLKEGAELSVVNQGQNLTMRKVSSTSWRRWRGTLKGTNALQEHEQEVERDAQEP